MALPGPSSWAGEGGKETLQLCLSLGKLMLRPQSSPLGLGRVMPTYPQACWRALLGLSSQPFHCAGWCGQGLREATREMERQEGRHDLQLNWFLNLNVWGDPALYLSFLPGVQRQSWF